MKIYDLVVIGGGPSGVSAARTAALHNKTNRQTQNSTIYENTSAVTTPELSSIDICAAPRKKSRNLELRWKPKSNLVCCILAGGIATVITLSGLWLLTPISYEPPHPGYFLCCLLLTMFWISYVTLQISFLCWIALKIFPINKKSSSIKKPVFSGKI